MSSHHFVKEGQEPALLLLDAIPLYSINGLLEWSPLIIVSSHCLDQVLSWGLKIDVVIVPEEKIDIIFPLITDFSPIKVIPYTVEDQFFPACAKYLIESGQREVTLITSHAADVFLKVERFLPRIGIVIQEEFTRWMPVFGDLEKWVPANTIFKIWCSLPQNEIFHHGLAVTEQGLRSTSDGLIRIWSNDLFWVGQEF